MSFGARGVGEKFREGKSALRDAALYFQSQPCGVFDVCWCGWQRFSVERYALADDLPIENELDAYAFLSDLDAGPCSTHRSYPLMLIKMPPSGERMYSLPSSHFPSSILRRTAFSLSPLIFANSAMVT